MPPRPLEGGCHCTRRHADFVECNTLLDTLPRMNSGMTLGRVYPTIDRSSNLPAQAAGQGKVCTRGRSTARKDWRQDLQHIRGQLQD
jgi:hypothetical protein